MGLQGGVLYVDKLTGSDAGRNGRNPTMPLKTIAQAISLSVDSDSIFINPGVYDESLNVAHTLSNLTLVGLGVRNAVEIKPTTIDTNALLLEGTNTRLVNLKATGSGLGVGAKSSGDYLLAENCVFSGGGDGIILTEGTAAEVGANAKDAGQAPRLIDCDIINAVSGLIIEATDNGAIHDILIQRCLFNDCSAASITEAGGTASDRFRGLEVLDCTFGLGDTEGGALPTSWISLGANFSNTGLVSRCSFAGSNAVAGLNIVKGKVVWVSNYHTNGVSTGQPA